ncbi:Asp-tRNA(Asn)/Glu-tRNA(Gln) amidotransferase subunit GatC [bacterium]|nr:Asp-tRNA(Asn)/Glu-tRNA(Gln) amidotransferase subunit GatC [bacterium]NBX98452.1 Asp-tRNA(Asn)/Glu-tRNA(Gln) amidotransferase subunit GatC [bacterium]NDC94106.1 Asp-tRNA(Asn)/Glu-tRNA(Gln) amidotransferase subunit GatC [bacterium]NDD83353.1 Asp-tRNA(Asn)/Glu-tRNA(Gln) amidotransferase subunit GatC [bacterium]NDG28931.1 Asp-tRNA(Asn)/Glu-tRNA(Gln) amidotransferase subunit GatC [bacterium]
MSQLSKQDILKLARLARLRLSDVEVEKYQKELSAILGYVEHLDSVDTSGLTPTYQVSGLTNVVREDEIIDYGTSQEDLLKNVPIRDGAYVKVKRML